jgi:hypothetical protein
MVDASSPTTLIGSGSLISRSGRKPLVRVVAAAINSRFYALSKLGPTKPLILKRHRLARVVQEKESAHQSREAPRSLSWLGVSAFGH